MSKYLACKSSKNEHFLRVQLSMHALTICKLLHFQEITFFKVGLSFVKLVFHYLLIFFNALFYFVSLEEILKNTSLCHQLLFLRLDKLLW